MGGGGDSTGSTTPGPLTILVSKDIQGGYLLHISDNVISEIFFDVPLNTYEHLQCLLFYFCDPHVTVFWISSIAVFSPATIFRPHSSYKKELRPFLISCIKVTTLIRARKNCSHSSYLEKCV